MSPFTILLLFVFAIPPTGAQPACDDLPLFPHVVCEELSVPQCTSAAQFGCVTTENNACALNPALASASFCSSNRYPVTSFILSPNSSVDFRLTVNADQSRIVSILIDASPSMREQIPDVVTELSALAESLITELSASIAISVYAGEESFRSSASHIPLQATTTNITAVKKALEILPNLQLFGGPRTLLQALDDIAITCGPNIIIVVGDTPGREPLCRFDDTREFIDRFNVIRPDFCFAPGTTIPTASLVAVSVGRPGLNSALAEPPRCPVPSSSSSYICLEVDECDPPVFNSPEEFRCVATCEPDPVAPIAPGQLSAIANIVNGSVVEGLNADMIFFSVQQIIQSDVMRFMLPTSTLLRDLDPPLPPGQGDDCGDRVWINSPELPMTIAGHSIKNISMMVSLSNRACENGPFVCTLIIHLERTAIFRSEQRFLVRACL
ncbi:hypothetical protein FGB62_60g011 [Gracilaria domingensis]|nr:hypothetical protein FGB62_60g011 [Gracilaria domingensis]